MSSSTEKKINFRLFRGLGRTLTISFLIFALVPITVVSVISYNKAYNSLEQEIQKGLRSTAVLKTQEISAYFNNMLTLLRFQSETEANAKLLQTFIDAHNASGKPLKEFVKSYQAALIVDEMAGDLTSFRSTFDYYDIFLIANNGDIYFTVARESDLGSNLFSGISKSSKFAAACKRTLETGKLSFSDYERYAPSGGDVYGFIIAPIINQDGDRIGAIVFQFPIDSITRIMDSGVELGISAETYLVGPDRTLRSGLTQDPTKALIDDKILTDQVEDIVEDLNKENGFDETDAQKLLVYQGPHGKKVLGVHHHLQIENITFAVIAEIEYNEAFGVIDDLTYTYLFLLAFTAFLVTFFVVFIVGRIAKPIVQLSNSTQQVEAGDFRQVTEINAKNEIGDLANSFNTMLTALSQTRKENDLKDWFQAGQVGINTVMRGSLELSTCCRDIVTYLAKYLGAEVGAFYTKSGKKHFKLTGSYAFSVRKHVSNEFMQGEGLPGQAALEKETILLTNVPADYITIRSGLGETTPCNILVKPIVRNQTVLGIIELGSLTPFRQDDLDFMDLISESIAIGIQTILSHIRVQELLEQSQAQTEELQSQQEELRQANLNLEKQTAALKVSEENLRSQQEELRQTNEELEAQTRLLENQKNAISEKNRELEDTRTEIEKKARDLDIASRYKSEFLANMSHELRTPLNSILLLSRHLSENKEGNLTEKQIECSSVVYSSGNELLNLINEVLDLAKVESGKMVLTPEDTYIQDIADIMERNFKPVAENKGINFEICIDTKLPETIRTDSQRLSQILKNLLSNAFKFTDTGGVTLDIFYQESATPFVFIVKDTGTGIAEEKLDVIFHAFKQADGSTSRKYGGTGLGLSISRELAIFLGGSLNVTSKPGKGSTFTLRLPKTISSQTEELTKPESFPTKSWPKSTEERKQSSGLKIMESTADSKLPEETDTELEYVQDDRITITEESRSILIIEDDPDFAKILRDTAREKGFRALIAESGEIGLQLTEFYTPDGIILDMTLPGIDGKTVLFRLKDNLTTRHIPVHIVSASDESIEPIYMGAIGYLTKPVTMESLNKAFSRIEEILAKRVKNVLVIEDNEIMQNEVVNLIANSSTVQAEIAATGKEARQLLQEKSFDCIILDLMLPDMSGEDFLTELRKKSDYHIPVIIHTARDLSSDELAMLNSFSNSIVIKNEKSQEKLLDDACLFLHQLESDLPKEKKEMIRKLHDREAILANKKVLIVDDDMRNVFSLVNILEDKGIKTITAQNGVIALSKLKENKDIDLVLMDIMMPEMDGYTAIKEIRKLDSKQSKVPIIALTAKAMKGDRVKCIEAGASDYLSKPVNADKLTSMLRVWLY